MKPPKMIDNKKNGSVAEELRLEIKKDSKLSVMTAYFTIFAFAELKKELMRVKQIRFLLPRAKCPTYWTMCRQSLPLRRRVLPRC